VKYGHWFQQDVYEFDAPFFNISAPEAIALDPQQRMLLECSYEAFENSGTPMSKVVGTDTSVFTACFATDYTDMLWRDPESVPIYQCTNSGFSRANMANRISYSFDLRGPSVTVDTACSGGLTALHLACQSLLSGDVKQAIAAGSSLVLGPEVMMTMSMMRYTNMSMLIGSRLRLTYSLDFCHLTEDVTLLTSVQMATLGARESLFCF
jgi:acyl transferase domain-containing protein